MKKVIVLGGGVAGLSALNRLVDLGVPALLIEGGSYPAHKICGEFLSAESMPILDSWNIPVSASIKNIVLKTEKKELQFPLSKSAGSISRYSLDQNLFERARKKGAQVLTNTKVVKINTDHVLLDNGENHSFTNLIISTGKWDNSAQVIRYFGIKGHLKGLEPSCSLEMFSFRGGYAGLSPIGNGIFNFACVMQLPPEDIDPIFHLFKNAPKLASRLENGYLIFNDWLKSPIPAFGIKERPLWPNVFFVGDAAATIPPATGLGLSIALSSGCMAADYALKGDFKGFRKAWNKQYQRYFAYGKIMHSLLMNPHKCNCYIGLAGLLPGLHRELFKLTRLKI